MVTTILVLSVASSTIAFAATPDLYQTIRKRLVSIGNTYLNKESALIQSGQENQIELKEYVENIETEMKLDLDEYEQQQIDAAKTEIQEQMKAVKDQMDQEKEQIVLDIKENIKKKIRKDLEKELEKIEKQLKQ
jgi:predicted metal-dependent hydrolase